MPLESYFICIHYIVTTLVLEGVSPNKKPLVLPHSTCPPLSISPLTRTRVGSTMEHLSDVRKVLSLILVYKMLVKIE